MNTKITTRSVITGHVLTKPAAEGQNTRMPKKPTCPDCGTVLLCYCPACSGRKGGRKGGLTTGPAKARTSEQARAAINARWERVRKAQQQAETK